jgi:hypothetical protein
MDTYPEATDDDRAEAATLQAAGLFNLDSQETIAQALAVARTGGDLRAFLDRLSEPHNG